MRLRRHLLGDRDQVVGYVLPSHKLADFGLDSGVVQILTDGVELRFGTDLLVRVEVAAAMGRIDDHQPRTSQLGLLRGTPQRGLAPALGTYPTTIAGILALLSTSHRNIAACGTLLLLPHRSHGRGTIARCPTSRSCSAAGGCSAPSEVGMLRALARRRRAARSDRWHQPRCHQRRAGRVAPGTARRRSTGNHVELVVAGQRVFGGSALRQVSTLARTRTHLHTANHCGTCWPRSGRGPTIEDLSIPFQCVAASIERAADTGSRAAGSSTPCSPAARCPGSFPRSRSMASTSSTAAWSTRSRSAGPVALGARTVYVLHVGRIERPLQPPSRPWEVAMVAFEIARRPPVRRRHGGDAGQCDRARPADRRPGTTQVRGPVDAEVPRHGTGHRTHPAGTAIRGGLSGQAITCCPRAGSGGYSSPRRCSS